MRPGRRSRRASPGGDRTHARGSSSRRTRCGTATGSVEAEHRRAGAPDGGRGPRADGGKLRGGGAPGGLRTLVLRRGGGPCDHEKSFPECPHRDDPGGGPLAERHRSRRAGPAPGRLPAADRRGNAINGPPPRHECRERGNAEKAGRELHRRRVEPSGELRAGMDRRHRGEGRGGRRPGRHREIPREGRRHGSAHRRSLRIPLPVVAQQGHRSLSKAEAHRRAPGRLSDMRFEASEGMDREEAREALFDAIDDLPPAQREVLVATELEGRSFKDLAEEWKTPIGTLLARKHRAMIALRETLSGGIV